MDVNLIVIRSDFPDRSQSLRPAHCGMHVRGDNSLLFCTCIALPPILGSFVPSARAFP
ncbi:hypothetical protein CBM2637_B110331 [Cupriavidus taiwanensis]|nr:hypothetical protein CBM2637_B110331 [Cupriavidus taiwanensis]